MNKTSLNLKILYETLTTITSLVDIKIGKVPQRRINDDTFSDIRTYEKCFNKDIVIKTMEFQFT